MKSDFIYCTICTKVLEKESFPPSRWLLKRSQCTKCSSNNSKKNPERPDRQRRNKLKYRYNTTPEELETLAVKQKYRCAVCGDKKSKISTKSGLVVDHDHKTGKIRGLLCDSCNILLGKAKDDTHILYLAAGYLLTHKNKEEL